MIDQFFIKNQEYIKSLLEERNIYKVTPSSIHRVIEWGKYPVIEATFYSTNRIAEKLFSGFKPIDHPFGSRLLHFNSLPFNPATGERMGRKTNVGTWAGARGAATSDGDTAVCEVSSQLNGGTFYNYRLFQPFDTSSIGAGATVISSNWSAYRDDIQEIGGNGAQDADSTSLEIVISTEADPTSYTASDYANVSFTSKGSLAFSVIGSNNNYINSGNGITISDLTIINVTTYTKLAIITGRDLNNSAPTGLNCQTFQNRSQTNPPILTVTYTPAVIGDDYAKFI